MGEPVCVTESGSAGCSYEVDDAVLPDVRCAGVLDSGTVLGAGNGRELGNSSAVVKVPFVCVWSAGVLLCEGGVSFWEVEDIIDRGQDVFVGSDFGGCVVAGL